MRFAFILAAPFLLLPAASAQSAAGEFSLAGTIVNSLTGAPVRNARVWLSTGDQVESDAAGAFHFSRLAAGQYAVAAAKAGFESNGDGVAVDLHASRANLVIRLTPLASVRGRITDAEGEPVDGVTMVAMRSQVADGWRNYEPAGKAVTDDRGQYRIPWLPAGRYLVQAAGYDEHAFVGEPAATPKTHDAFAPVYFGGSRDRDSAVLLALAPGGEAHADISLTLQAGHRITGHLANLKPHTQPVLQLLSGDEDLGLNHSSLDFFTGDFQIDNVVDGAYRLRVTGVGADDRPLVAEQEIQIDGHDVTGISLALGQGFTVKGTMRIDGPDGQTTAESVQEALQGSFLQLVARGGPTFPSEPAVDGAFQIPSVIPGRYRVGFAVAEPLYVASARSGDTDLLADPELVLRSEPPPEIEVVLRTDSGSIEGTLAPETMRDGPVCIVLVSESSRRPPEAACTGDGSFGFAAVAPGSYRLHAWKSRAEVEYNAPQVLTTLAASGTPVEVRPAANTKVQLQTLSEESP
jgi:hypothetical protein